MFHDDRSRYVFHEEGQRRGLLSQSYWPERHHAFFDMNVTSFVIERPTAKRVIQMLQLARGLGGEVWYSLSLVAERREIEAGGRISWVRWYQRSVPSGYVTLAQWLRESGIRVPLFVQQSRC